MSKKHKRQPKPITNDPVQTPKKEPKPARYVQQPRVFCTLNPTDWTICVELPGPAGRRLIPLESLDCLRSILMDQMVKIEAMQPSAIGHASEPTEAQVRHWEEHSRRSQSTKLASNCPFCISEARAPIHRFDKHGKPIIPGVGDPDLLGI